MSLGTLCNREVVITEPDTSIQTAAALMRDYHVGCVIVTEKTNNGNKPIGILTDRDIVIELIAKNVDPNAVTVGDIMSREIDIADEQDCVLDTIKHMRHKGIRRMPVTDGAGVLIGLITLDDLIELLAEQLKDLSSLINNEQRSEKRAHP